MRRLRLLWVTPHLPRRGVNAARERWWQLTARVAARHDLTLLAFVDPEDEPAAPALPPGLAAVHLVPRRFHRPDDPLALLPRTVAGGLASPDFRDAVAARLAGERWDVVQYEYVEMAHCIPGPAPRSILTVHQLGFAQEGDAWRAQGGGARAAGVFLHRHLRELDFELRAVRRVDHVITMSDEDAARLLRFHPDLGVSVSPCGVDCAEFRPAAEPPPAAVELVFVGHFGHPPNVDAMRFLVHDVMPRMGRAVRLRIVGRDAGPAVTALARPGAVEVTGAVDDVRPHLAAGAVFVAPVRFGTGMRGKILEALALGRPVVTTSVGAEGLGAAPGRHLLVADGAGDFAAGVRRVLDDPALARTLGAGGRALVESRFDWGAIAAAHDDIYDRVLREPSRAAAGADGRAHRLQAIAGRLGWAPGLALGTSLLAARALRWHLRRLRARPASPPLGRTAAVRGGTAA
jgi:glycosyltransferase involved in cell wall biosynthesis